MKQVKAIDIARELNISKASVSLALNNKPGVSAQKRDEIFAVKRRLEAELNGKSIPSVPDYTGSPKDSNIADTFLSNNNAVQGVNDTVVIPGNISGKKLSDLDVLELPGKPGLTSSAPSEQTATGSVSPIIYRTPKEIKLVFMNRAVTASWEMGNVFPAETISAFANGAREAGYTLGVTYCTTSPASLASLEAECNIEQVAGVIIHATELTPRDAILFQGIHKPLVFYDCQAANGLYHAVAADNRIGVYEAMDYLFRKGYKDVIYLAHSGTIFNFLERRRWFQTYLLSHGRDFDSMRQLYFLGSDSYEMYDNMKKWLKEHPLPQAFLMENYQISGSVVRALLDEGYRIPQDVSLIGIDAVSSFNVNGLDLTYVEIPHGERAEMAIQILLREIQKPSKIKSKILAYCPLIEGKSVKNEY